jgi:hypothetical protein
MKILRYTAILLLSATAAHAQWTLQINDDLVSALDNSGTLVKASNLGDGTQSAVTFSGITFDTDLSNVTQGTAPGDRSQSEIVYTGGDADIGSLLNTQFIASSWSAPSNVVIALNGLSIGQQYRMQVVLTPEWEWSGAGVTATGGDTIWYDGTNALEEAVGTHLFTADATSMTYTMDNTGDADGSYHYISAYALHAVPEPSTTALVLGLAGVALVMVRRRRK